LRLLLDTHVFLWAAAEPERLSISAREAIEHKENQVYVSAATGWEIAIKHAIGRLVLPVDPSAYVPGRIRSLGFDELPIAMSHTLAASQLPPHHADPFDRILVAQAQVEGLTLASADPLVLRYPVSTLQARGRRRR
jgi:PIN domain nuclease of toxin-antitoxin system